MPTQRKASKPAQKAIEAIKQLFPNVRILTEVKIKTPRGTQFVDILLPDFNIAIEVDGRHHREKVNYSGDTIQATTNFVKTRMRDNAKEIALTEAGITLIRIDDDADVHELHAKLLEAMST